MKNLLYFASLVLLQCCTISLVSSDPSICTGTTCGLNTECGVEEGRPVCTCQKGFFGNPLVGCKRDELKEADICVGVCGLYAHCKEIHGLPVCTCLPGYIGNPFAQCMKVFVSSDHSICTGTTCGPNTECRVVEGRPVCTCQRGFIGPPLVECKREELKEVDICAGICGGDASCKAIHGLPICTCLPGYTGDPFTQCMKVFDAKLPEPVKVT